MAKAGMDLLVRLYDLEEDYPLLERLKQEGIRLVRVMPGDRDKILAFSAAHFSPRWDGLVRAAFARQPVSCFAALRAGEIVGFGCYDTAFKGAFTPLGVLPDLRGKGIGRALLLRCLLAMEEEGYAYGIISWADDAKAFYEKTVGAIPIPHSFPGVYRRMVEWVEPQDPVSP